MKSEFFLDGKKYISSRRASEISKYTSEYIAKLCRRGKLEGTLIGKTWFVEESSLKILGIKGEEKRNDSKDKNNFDNVNTIAIKKIIQTESAKSKEYAHIRIPITKQISTALSTPRETLRGGG